MQEAIQTILAAVEDAHASRVTGVELVLGVSGHFKEEAVRQYFQSLTLHTPIEGATLTLSWLPATYQCLSCQQRFESTLEEARCPQCGDIGFEVSHQDVCYVQSIDVLPFDK